MIFSPLSGVPSSVEARPELPRTPAALPSSPGGTAAVTVPLRVLRVEDRDPFAAVRGEWQALHERLSPATPFTSPLWNELWWRHYRSQRLSVRDELHLHVVRDAADRLVAVAPMMATERPSFGPLRIRTLHCFGADPNVTELRGLVCRPLDEVAALGALSAHFARDGRWDWIQWGGVRAHNWPRAADAVGRCAPALEIVVSDYHLDLPGSWEDFRASRSRNIKESIRKCYNSLKRDGLQAELKVVSRPDDCAAALETFFRLHAARGRAANTVSHNDVFAQQQDRGFIGAYVDAMARAGQARILQLWIAGGVVATRLAFQLGDELYLYYSGYDVTWGKYSVMTTLLAEAIKWAIEQRLRVVNLSTGTDVSKLRWRPTETSFRALTQLAPRWRARLAFEAYQQSRRIHRHPRLGRLLALAGR